MDSPELTLCRVTVNIPGARVGDYVRADLSDPQLARMAQAGILYVEPEEEVLPEDAPELEAEVNVETTPAHRGTDEVLADLAKHGQG